MQIYKQVLKIFNFCVVFVEKKLIVYLIRLTSSLLNALNLKILKACFQKVNHT